MRFLVQVLMLPAMSLSLVPSQVLARKREPTKKGTGTKGRRTVALFSDPATDSWQLESSERPRPESKNGKPTSWARADENGAASEKIPAPCTNRAGKQRPRNKGASPSSKPRRKPVYGNDPNVYWQAVSMEELRAHPGFNALPPPSDVKLETLQDLTQFRQDSWQWAALHTGRLTTSKAAACLGLYEALGARRVGVPNSLAGHSKAVSAWSRLMEEPVTFEELQRMHGEETKKGSASSQGKSDEKGRDEKGGGGGASAAGELSSPLSTPPGDGLWLPNSGRIKRSTRAGYRIQPRPPVWVAEEAADRKGEAQPGTWRSGLNSVRMAWGSAQEATSLLNILNSMQHLEVNMERASALARAASSDVSPGGSSSESSESSGSSESSESS
eukprot:CAMPEP_0172610314 /NCGR_PEP_ID=MMETSP1068-20121228/30133_1 /TAXON_ID=35684 /ORGANISM="Pseudopedinella elastica, Strain CCMP716" /LENGTH=385 /DNA_ID=CAMNT_0013413989 /DNA_START=59 /DNA_END=1213 /DNA_ORIENTATION=-